MKRCCHVVKNLVVSYRRIEYDVLDVVLVIIFFLQTTYNTFRMPTFHLILIKPNW